MKKYELTDSLIQYTSHHNIELTPLAMVLCLVIRTKSCTVLRDVNSGHAAGRLYSWPAMGFKIDVLHIVGINAKQIGRCRWE